MAKGKLSPRQKMINLMYLVFIAMLAMQIDQEIIRSYQDTNQSLTDSRTLAQDKNKIFLQTLTEKANNSPETFGIAKTQYSGMESKANDLVDFIEDIKNDLKKNAGYIDGTEDVEENFSSLNNTEAGTNKFFNGGDAELPSPTSKELLSKMSSLKDYIVQNFSSSEDLKSVVDRAKKNLSADGSKYKKQGKTWLQYKFYNQPLIAALSNLEVIQSEVRNLQSDALSLMLKEKVDADIQFNAYEAIVAGPTAIQQGESATAKVLIGTYASTLPGLRIDNAQVVNGQGVLNLGGDLGEHTIGGNISFLGDKGKTVTMPYKFTYNVVSGKEALKAQEGALLSADKMNVLYRGVANPITGSILGADTSGLTLSAPGASVSGGRGKWTVTPGSGNTVALTISGKDPKGKVISQKFDFRIKNVPPPQGQIRNENVLNMPASSIPNQTISAAIPEFDFPVTFTVTSFKFKVPGRAAMLVNGNSMSSVASMVKGLRSGDIVYVADIQATASGLGGQTLKKISPIVINVQ
ncbi:gliding motility protein GldM [Cloacibacterium rupense]|uniref:Gliding motility protein GldM n=1 Tax=Cloacibacterium rupense TaxID=517423 RepID=A0ABQ2NJV5_9FLAO|nr:gliding motility protein GldM [Cloacibacterium rupense]GGP04338.1 gliding motility protein GldM [Cloacibacterium rupense]